MDIFTIQNSQWRLARNRDIVMMDTSVKSGFSIFRPTWDMVMEYKRQEIDEAEYTLRYHAHMNASWKANRGKWLETIESKEPMAFGCMCGYLNEDGTVKFCHRHLLKNIFEKLCNHRGIEFCYYGELRND